MSLVLKNNGQLRGMPSAVSYRNEARHYLRIPRTRSAHKHLPLHLSFFNLIGWSPIRYDQSKALYSLTLSGPGQGVGRRDGCPGRNGLLQEWGRPEPNPKGMGCSLASLPWVLDNLVPALDIIVLCTMRSCTCPGLTSSLTSEPPKWPNIQIYNKKCQILVRANPHIMILKWIHTVQPFFFWNLIGSSMHCYKY